MECNKEDLSQEISCPSAPTTDTATTHDFVVALVDYQASGPNQLSFEKGQKLQVLQRTNSSWWWVELSGNHGYIPTNHVSAHVTYLQQEQAEWQDEEYFGSYGNLKIHHEMLSDKPRTLAYRNAIVQNASGLKGKIVLDVGCGTGILSMMCVHHGGVRKVYAVEASEVADSTRKVIAANGFSDQISVIRDYAENVTLDEKVDLIISEWMGTILLFEMMIESVIIMRDRFLQDDGTVWPSSARLYMVPCSAHAQYRSKIDFWDTQYGFDFSVLKGVAKDDLLLKPVHDYSLPLGDCLSQAKSVLEVDLKTVSVPDLEDNTSQFKFIIRKGSILHGFCFWFEAQFSPLCPDGETLYLNTGPEHELTHWKQNLFLLDDPITVATGDRLDGTVRIYRNPEFRRHLRVDLKFKVFSGESAVSDALIGECTKTFYVWR